MTNTQTRDPSFTPSAPPRALTESIARLNARAWGIAFALLAALGLLMATWLLVLKGGPVVGPHLALLSNFFPGYSVTWSGGLIGFVYAFVVGYAIGRLIGTVYNRLIPAPW